MKRLGQIRNDIDWEVKWTLAQRSYTGNCLVLELHEISRDGVDNYAKDNNIDYGIDRVNENGNDDDSVTTTNKGRIVLKFKTVIKMMIRKNRILRIPNSLLLMLE